MSPRSPRVLLVAGEPDTRESSRTLKAIAEELASRPGAAVEVWFLRDPHGEAWGAERRVVDDLRTWATAVAAERVGLGSVGHRLRGARLRSWARRARPDLVLLDDGLGERLLRSLPGGPNVAIRVNAESSPTALWEPSARATATLVLGDDDRSEPSPDGEWFNTPDLVDVADVIARTEPARRRWRRELGLGDSDVLVTGWGSDGWIDGPDLFVRALWHLEHRQGIVAHGLWFDLGPDADEADRLRAEAVRCGVGDRFRLAESRAVEDRAVGDAVLLPYRSPAPRLDMLAAAVVAPVVAFTTGADPAAWLERVAPLDLDAVAVSLARAVSPERAAIVDAVQRRHDVAGWVDRFLAKAAELDAAAGR